MSEEDKVSTARGFRLRSIKEMKAQRPGKWSPGVRVISENEYKRFTEQLARELLTTYSPEHLAVIAAQHMMYSNELKCVLEEKKAELVGVVEIARKVATDVATEISITVLKSYRTHHAKKRADRVRKVKASVMALARSMAKEWWCEDAEQKIKTGGMAKKVYDALLETEYRKLVANQRAVHRWIASVAPEYAKQPGPSQ